MDISKTLLKSRLFRHLLYGGRQSFTLLCGAFIFLSSATVNANLCNAIIDQAVSQDTVDQVAFYRNELFDEPAYHGSEAWNRIILECNRRRDTKGSEIKNALTGGGSDANKELLKSGDLPPKVIRGHYNFRGDVAFQQKYRYVLSKEDGKWTMIIPYKAIINDIVKDRIDFYMGSRDSEGIAKRDIHERLNAAWKLYEESEVIPGTKQTGPDNAPVARKAPQDALDDLVSYRLKPGAEPIAQTLCEDSTFFPGKEHRYDGKSDENSNKRDKENRHISTGKIQYRHHRTTWKLEDSWREGCRVKKDTKLYLQEDPNSRQVVEINPADWILDNFISVAEKYWSTPDNFTLRILLKDYNDDSFDEDIVALLDDSDYLTVRFATKFMPYKNNQMYKSNIAQFNNFSTMTTDGTYFHEVGHALSLGDEYGKDATKKSCHHSYYDDYGTDSYQMCSTGALETRTIYHFIAVSHYLTAQNECTDDNQCEEGKEWCDKGVDLQKNQCRPLLNDGSTCPLVNGGHACRSGHCKFKQCYTPNSVAIGGHCFVNDQCREGKCNNITDGTGGTCVCDDDEQCGGGRYCDMGADFRRNTCRNLKADNEACALFNGGRTCQSGLCADGRCYTPHSVPLGGTCYVGDACSKGKCNNAVNGTRGTCVCDSDNDCDSGYWCDRGLDLSNNSCKRKYAEGEICGKVGELNVGHRCLSGKCKAAGLINLKCKE